MQPRRPETCGEAGRLRRQVGVMLAVLAGPADDAALSGSAEDRQRRASGGEVGSPR
jgi:hypothetical protein